MSKNVCRYLMADAMKTETRDAGPSFQYHYSKKFVYICIGSVVSLTIGSWLVVCGDIVRSIIVSWSIEPYTPLSQRALTMIGPVFFTYISIFVYLRTRPISVNDMRIWIEIHGRMYRCIKWTDILTIEHRRLPDSIVRGLYDVFILRDRKNKIIIDSRMVNFESLLTICQQNIKRPFVYKSQFKSEEFSTAHVSKRNPRGW
jgi:hypothetical protein